MKRNTILKSIKYSVGEILLVVIGILIALQINYWNERRKSDNNLKIYYGQIMQELEKDKTYIQQRMVQLDSSIIDTKKHLNEIQKQTSLEGLINSQASLTLTPKLLYFSTNTIETLQTTGDLKLLPVEIRSKILDLKNKQNAWIEITSINNSNIAKNVLTAVNLGLSNNVLDLANNKSTQLYEQLNILDNFPKIALILNGVIGLKNQNEVDLKEGLESMIQEINYVNELIVNEFEK